MLRDRIGLAFFTFATVVSFLAAWEYSSLLAWLAAVHNAIVAFLYARRTPAVKYDHLGLWLGLLASAIPMTTIISTKMSLPRTITGLVGYSLVFWSLLSLGNRFGIAPADRGLVMHGPYRFLRHPMYLGELILRAALVTGSHQVVLAAGSLISLAVIQILRAIREEQIITGYDVYSSLVPYRLVPGVW